MSDIKHFINRMTAQIDTHRALLIMRKEILTTLHADKVIDLIQAAKKQCKDISNAREQDICKEAKALACNAFKEKFVPQVTQYNALLDTYKNNSDFSQLKVHKESYTDLTIVEAIEIIGKVNLGYIDCDTTTTSLSPTTDPTPSPMSVPNPTPAQTLAPTTAPTAIPTEFPVLSPTMTPTIPPTLSPTITPTPGPTTSPTPALLIGVYCNGVLEQTVSSLPSGIVCECNEGEHCTLNFA